MFTLSKMKFFNISLYFNTKDITQLSKIYKMKFYLQVVNRMNGRRVGSSDNYIIYIDQ